MFVPGTSNRWQPALGCMENLNSDVTGKESMALLAEAGLFGVTAGFKNKKN